MTPSTAEHFVLPFLMNAFAQKCKCLWKYCCVYCCVCFVDCHHDDVNIHYVYKVQF